MKMATENLKGEQSRRLEARKKYIEEHLKPLDDLNALSDGKISSNQTKKNFSLKLISYLAQLKSLCQDLHNQLKTHEEARYDIELKIRKQDYDVISLKKEPRFSIYLFFSQINELNIKINDIKGKFVKPSLKKVSKTEQK